MISQQVADFINFQLYYPPRFHKLAIAPSSAYVWIDNLSFESLPPSPEDRYKNCGRPECNLTVGNPVNVATGNKYEEAVDLAISAPGIPLEFRRAYNSHSTDDGPLGYGWTHNFNISLEEVQQSPKRVLIKDSDGRYLYFTESGGVFTGESGVIDKLYANDPSSGHYTLLRKQGNLEYVFEYETGNKWRLTEIFDPNENSLTFYYTGSNLTEIRDNFGKSLFISYDTNNRISSVRAPEGQSVTYVYENTDPPLFCPAGNLCIVEYRDKPVPPNPQPGPLKDSIKYFYDSNHNLTDKKDTNGDLFGHWGYDPSDRVNNYYSHKIGNDAQEEISLSYPTGMTTVTRMIGGQPTLTNYITKVINGIKVIERVEGCSLCGGGIEKKYEYVPGRLDISKVIAVDNGEYTTEYQYHDPPYSWEIHYMTEALNHPPYNRTTTYEYTPLVDDPFLMANRTETKPSVVPGCSQGKVIATTYDTKGKILSRVETGCILINGIPTQKSYATTYEYDNGLPSGPGQLTKINGPRTGINITNFLYYPNTPEYVDEDSDKRGRLQVIKNRVNEDLDLITEFVDYDKNGNVKQVKDPNGIFTEYTYDERNRVKSKAIKRQINETTWETLAETSYSYDARGNLDHVILPELNGIYFTYNAANKLGEIRNQLGNKIIYKYNKEGNKEREEIWTPPEVGYPEGALRKQLDFAYDQYNRLWQIKNPDPGQTYTEYLYDGRGNVTSVKDPRNNTTSYDEYDPLNRLKKMTQPGNVFTDYDYDTHDNLKTVIDPNENTTTYVYDDFGRKNSTVSLDTGTTRYEYDEAGNLVKRTDAKGTVVNYFYDGLNRLTVIDFPGSTEDITFTYDSASVEFGKGKLTGRTDPSGTYTFYYHPDGRLKKEEKSITGDGSYTTQYEYNDNGVLTKITYPTGRIVNYDLDSVDKTRISQVWINDSSTLLASGITYLPFGGITRLVYGNNLTLTQEYDYQYRVSPIQVSSIHDLNYEYDASGNATSIVDLLNPSGGPGLDLSEAYSYQPGTNRLNQRIAGSGTISYGYDENGNIKTETGWFYKYDQSNQLTEVREDSQTGPLIATYTYNGIGQRIKKVAGGTTRIFHYDQIGHLIAETNQSGQMQAEYIYLGDQLLAMIKPGEAVYYYHNDHLGTPQVLTDATGTIVWKAAYNPFGEATISVQAVENPFRFPGQYYDQETGLHYNYFRYYDPTTGRYVTPDPIGLEGGINLFSYVDGNPLSFIDPLGLSVYFCQGYFNNHKYRHALVCVKLQGITICEGLMPASESIIGVIGNYTFHGPGEVTGEPYPGDENCKEMKIDDKCCDQDKYDACVKNKIKSALGSNHFYGLLTYNCVAWAKDVILSCQKEACQK
jgi:RHS repeat-associated protein